MQCVMHARARESKKFVQILNLYSPYSYLNTIPISCSTIPYSFILLYDLQ